MKSKGTRGEVKGCLMAIIDDGSLLSWWCHETSHCAVCWWIWYAFLWTIPENMYTYNKPASISWFSHAVEYPLGRSTLLPTILTWKSNPLCGRPANWRVVRIYVSQLNHVCSPRWSTTRQENMKERHLFSPLRPTLVQYPTLLVILIHRLVNALEYWDNYYTFFHFLLVTYPNLIIFITYKTLPHCNCPYFLNIF